MSGFARFASGLMTLTLAVLLVIGGTVLWFMHETERAGPLETTRSFGVPRGEGPIEIAARLEREGIITNRWVFVAGHYGRVLFNRKNPQHLKAGQYAFQKAASLAEVHDILVKGRSVLSKITLPEGLTSAQIVERLNGVETLDGEIEQVPPEGSLLPDTYHYTDGMKRQELIDRMQAESTAFLASAWENRSPDLPVSTPQEALILASIIEKETGQADERERVAAVFVNRLRKNMRLQSDPTIIYGLVGGKGSLGRPITRSDIDGVTPYNTYRINGLPPTPICNPGRSAIQATLSPAKTDDLYFVADGSGGHAFSSTLKEHNDAVSKWRKIERQARQEAAEGTGAAPNSAPIPAPSANAALPNANGSPTVTTLNSGASPAATSEGPSSAPPLPLRKPRR